MTMDRSVDERIREWIFDEASGELPDRVLRATFDRTRATSQRRTYPGARFFRSLLWRPTLIAIGAAAVIVVAVGLALYQRQNSSVGVSPTPSPVESPTGQIAFERTVDGNTDIYMMNVDGTGLVRLTDDPARDSQPAWTPDGATLVFARSMPQVATTADIFALNIATNDLVQLTDERGVEADAKVSPDGTLIAYDHWPLDPGFRVMNIDGSNKRLIFTPPDDQYGIVGWTPDGTALYVDHSGEELLRLDLESHQFETVLTGASQSALTLSPDGTTFAFQSHTAPGGIWIMDVDGSNPRHVTGSRIDTGAIAWSPGGTHLAFNGPDDWLYIVGKDGSGLTGLIEGGRQLAWRPAQ
jgi:Tol biopolymer transport system component